jgi:hypothetical protein
MRRLCEALAGTCVAEVRALRARTWLEPAMAATATIAMATIQTAGIQIFLADCLNTKSSCNHSLNPDW